MCGIAGLIDPGRRSDGDSLERVATAIGDALTHRGLDSGGVLFDAEAGLAVAHWRLSIVALSPAGTQPIWSPTAAGKPSSRTARSTTSSVKNQ
jgi:asparagine synthase (glutamine-hydrolysing)